MLEETYGKAAMKKMQVFHGVCESVEGNPRCG
jgi:hypothetical protein